MKELLLSLVLVCATASASAQEKEEEKPSPLSAEVSFTQFLQGPIVGGLGSDPEYGGRLDLELTIDPAALDLWSRGTFTVEAMTRYGESAAPQVGAAMPVNTALLMPAGGEETVTALVALNYTHLIPLDEPADMIALAIGKFDGFDLVTEAFLGGGGITKWMNLAQTIPPHEAGNITTLTPYAFMASLILAGETRGALGLIDPVSPTTTSGLDDIFEEGVALLGSVIFPSHFFGKAGHHELRVTWSNREKIPFSQLPQLLLPAPIRNLDPVSSAWTLTLTGDQYFSENPGPPRTGWGAFWTLGLGEPENNAIPLFVNVGFGGSSPFANRPSDSAGLAFGYIGFSEDFEDVLDPGVALRDEWEAEFYYGLALAEWCVLTADLQLIHPFRAGADTSLVPGARLQLIF